MRDVAIVSFAQRVDAAQRAATKSRCSSPVHRRGARDSAKLERRDDRLHRLGELRLPRRAPLLVRHGARRGRRLAPHPRVARRDGRRVGALRGVGARSSTATSTSALVYAFGRSSQGDLRDVLGAQLDPYYVAPLAPTAVSLAALQARALLDAGRCTERDMAARRGAQRARRRDADALLDGALRRGSAPRARLRARRRTASPPSCSWRATARAKVLRAPGVDPRHRSPHRGRTRSACRDLTRSAVDDARGREGRGRPGAASTSPRFDAPFSHQELILRDALGLDAKRARSTRPAARSPGDRSSSPGLLRIGEAAPPRPSTGARRAPSRTPRRVRACSRTSSASWRRRHDEPLRRHRHRPDQAHGQAGRRLHRRARARGGAARARGRGARAGRTSTPSSSARPPTCSRA